MAKQGKRKGRKVQQLADIMQGTPADPNVQTAPTQVSADEIRHLRSQIIDDMRKSYQWNAGFERTDAEIIGQAIGRGLQQTQRAKQAAADEVNMNQQALQQAQMQQMQPVFDVQVGQPVMPQPQMGVEVGMPVIPPQMQVGVGAPIIHGQGPALVPGPVQLQPPPQQAPQFTPAPMATPAAAGMAAGIDTPIQRLVSPPAERGTVRLPQQPPPLPPSAITTGEILPGRLRAKFGEPPPRPGNPPRRVRRLSPVEERWLYDAESAAQREAHIGQYDAGETTTDAQARAERMAAKTKAEKIGKSTLSSMDPKAPEFKNASAEKIMRTLRSKGTFNQAQLDNAARLVSKSRWKAGGHEFYSSLLSKLAKEGVQVRAADAPKFDARPVGPDTVAKAELQGAREGVRRIPKFKTPYGVVQEQGIGVPRPVLKPGEISPAAAKPPSLFEQVRGVMRKGGSVGRGLRKLMRRGGTAAGIGLMVADPREIHAAPGERTRAPEGVPTYGENLSFLEKLAKYAGQNVLEPPFMDPSMPISQIQRLVELFGSEEE